MAPLLDPVLVLDLSEGPLSYCGRLLADLGADVILIEPAGGSPARRGAAGEMTAAFAFTGRQALRHDRPRSAGRGSDLPATGRSCRRCH